MAEPEVRELPGPGRKPSDRPPLAPGGLPPRGVALSREGGTSGLAPASTGPLPALWLLCPVVSTIWVTRVARSRGARAAQPVKHLTLDFSSGRDLMVRGIEPHVGFPTRDRPGLLHLARKESCFGGVSLANSGVGKIRLVWHQAPPPRPFTLFGKSSFIGTQLHPFMYTLPVTPRFLQCQS